MKATGAIRFAVLAGAAMSVAGCGTASSSAPADGGAEAASAALPAASTAFCAEVDAAAGNGCHTTGRVFCNAGAALGIPMGPPVTTAMASGPLLLPAGGPLVDGSYQLVGQTLYGSPPPNVILLGLGTQAVLELTCDFFNELYGGAVGLGSGNNCGRLAVPSDAGDAPYTAVGDMLYLFQVLSYEDQSRSLGLGTYELVNAFQRLPASSQGASLPCGPLGADVPRPLRAGERDPGCPANPPAQGTPCNPQPPPLECEYGGDAFGDCTTLAVCAVQADGGFSFLINPPSGYVEPSCSPNPDGCPATFTDALALQNTAPPTDGGCPPQLACDYPEGVCASCAPYAGCTWQCRRRGSVDPMLDGGSCPNSRPLSGNPCPDEGELCYYDNVCESALSLGPSMVCRHGTWEQIGEVSGCLLENVCVQPLVDAGGD